MSLEESMSKLAASNLELAAAFNNYANTLNNIANANPESIVVHRVEGTSSGADAGKTEKAKPGPKPKKDPPAAAATTSDDGFGEEEVTYTFDDAKAKLMAVKDKAGDKQPALDIIGKYGYKALPEIGEAHYAAIIKDCDAYLAKK